MKILNLTVLSALFFLLFTSCSDYLDKSPAAGLTEADIFKSFDKFQGFIEDAYDCMSDPMNGNNSTNFNMGDDILQVSNNYMPSQNSDYRNWETSIANYFYSPTTSVNGEPLKFNSNPYIIIANGSTSYTSGDGYASLGYWDGGWLGIRKVNIAIANLDKMTVTYKDAPLQEQKDLIDGQAHFLRAYFYFQMIRIWGGLPYIKRVLSPNDDLNFPRLSYFACSDSIEKDLLYAIDKLPVNWDATQTGQITKGTNEGRLTKGAAYALLGKAMLYAGSPLMNGTVTGNYTYNNDYLKKSIKYFGEVIKLSALGGGTTYDLLPWSNYSDNFFMFAKKIPARGKEGILNTPNIGHLRRCQIGDFLTSMGGFGSGDGPLENYVQYFGMNDGTAFNPDVYNTPSINPFANRDPRFYKNIVYDGRILTKNATTSKKAEFYIGGTDRGGAGRSDTGYGWQKFRDSTIYGAGSSYNYSADVNRSLPVIRLADVYLMYSEAVNEVYGPTGDPSASTDCNVKAWEALKAVRDRVITPAGTPLPLPSSYYADQNSLRESIRRERAVELAFENIRWYDLRRWYVSDQPEYMRMDVLDFDAGHTYFKVRSFAKKIFEKKHFWMPIKDTQTQLYSAFSQNPGW